jgi:hypothetical protein
MIRFKPFNTFLNELKQVKDDKNNLLHIEYSYCSFFPCKPNSKDHAYNIYCIVEELLKFNKIKLKLEFSGLALKYIPENIFKLVNLIDLDLTCNKIETISKDILNLKI